MKNDHHTVDFVLLPFHVDGENRGWKQRTERFVLLPKARPGESLCAWPYRSGESCEEEKKFMIAFLAVMAVALILVIRVWNGVHTFWPAYLQALLFLEVMNWYDGIVIDRLWVGHSYFWVIPGTEEIPFVQTWTQVLKKRGILTVIWIAGAAIIAGIIVIF